MNYEELDVADVKSLLQANATILAGALIFVSLLHETFDISIINIFLAGIYSTILSIFFCLATTWTSKNQRVALMEILRRGFCISGLVLLFTAMSLFLWFRPL